MRIWIVLRKQKRQSLRFQLAMHFEEICLVRCHLLFLQLPLVGGWVCGLGRRKIVQAFMGISSWLISVQVKQTSPSSVPLNWRLNDMIWNHSKKWKETAFIQLCSFCSQTGFALMTKQFSKQGWSHHHHGNQPMNDKDQKWNLIQNLKI